jgi:arylformamidase
MLIELSRKIHESMVIYPGTPKERFVPHTRINRGDQNNTTVLYHFLHAGTHVDAPYHFNDAGATIDSFPIDDFLYNCPVLIDVPFEKSRLISFSDISNARDIATADILLFRTNFVRSFELGKARIDEFPGLSLEAAEFLRSGLPSLKAVAIDTFSIEDIGGSETNFAVHHALLDEKSEWRPPLLVYENVALNELPLSKIVRIYAFPLRILGAEASPIAMVAEVAG